MQTNTQFQLMMSMEGVTAVTPTKRKAKRSKRSRTPRDKKEDDDDATTVISSVAAVGNNNTSPASTTTTTSVPTLIHGLTTPHTSEPNDKESLELCKNNNPKHNTATNGSSGNGEKDDPPGGGTDGATSEDKDGIVPMGNDDTTIPPPPPSMAASLELQEWKDENKDDDNDNTGQPILLRRRSSLLEALPETPAGWAVLLSLVSSGVLGYEMQVQKSLTCPPLVFGQIKDNSSSLLEQIYQRLTQTPESILSRPVHPSLFVGTRAAMASAAAYALWGPPPSVAHSKIREILTMSQDGAQIALDWECPMSSCPKGPITKPVILILTGMNNDSSFGYIQSLMRTMTNRGWMAVCMNFRGCSVPLSTPRGYNGAYTGDVRCVVQTIASRLATPDIPLFLIGNSLGANIVTKYLGEEGLSGTLPSCVAGGVSLGNPLVLHSDHLHSPWAEVLALGLKKYVLQNWNTIRQMTSSSFQTAIRKTLLARTMGQVDAALAPIFIRNSLYYPFCFSIGYESNEAYWADASSWKLIQHVSVPLLQIIAGDDMIVYESFQRKLSHCIQNPLVMCVETKCGGHLGWQESNLPMHAQQTSSATGSGSTSGAPTTSWADRAAADFIQAILEIQSTTHPAKERPKGGGILEIPPPFCKL